MACTGYDFESMVATATGVGESVALSTKALLVTLSTDLPLTDS